MIEVARDDLYLKNPRAILETFLLATTPGIKGLSARRCARAVQRAQGDGRRTSATTRGHATFRAMLMQPGHHARHAADEPDLGAGRYLWVFRRIVGQMQHDLFHVYTVDQHILMVLRNVRRFFIAEHAHEYPFCSQLAAGWDKPWILYTAALFHDIAKGAAATIPTWARARCGASAGSTGSPRGLQADRVPGARAPGHEPVAQKEDLGDPAVIQSFAQRVGNERYLTALYLLTVADIRGTSPKVWNAWKGKLLEDLYRYTPRAGRRHARPKPRSRRASARRWCSCGCSPCPEAHKKLWDTLDVGYFMRHDAGDIAWHTRASRATWAPPRCWCARMSAVGEGLQDARVHQGPARPVRASAAISTRPASASWTPRSTRPPTATRWTPSRWSRP